MQEGRAQRPAWPLLAALGVGAFVVHLARLELIPFAMAAILGFVLDPAIRRLQRMTGWPRWAAASGLFAVLLVVGSALALAMGLDTGEDARRLAASGPSALHQMLQKALGDRGLHLFGQTLSADSVSADMEAAARRLLDARLLARVVPPLFAIGVGLVALVLLTFYAMVSGPELARGAVRLVPPSRRPALERVLPEMVQVVQRYFIGVSAVAAFTIVMAWLGYALVLHVKGAVLLSVVVGLLETVPAVGPAISAVLVSLAALQLHSLAAMGVMIGYSVALRFTIDDLIAPIVLGKSVTVHPVVVMFAYLMGAVMFGVIGVLLAVPTAACIRIALRYAYAEGEGAS